MEDINPKLLKKALDKHPFAEEFFFTEDDIRWATPKIVADYRAKRLKCNVIVDLCSGIGLQTLSFAGECKKVYAVEIDKDKLECAKKNAHVLGIDNITFIHGDCLSDDVLKKLSDAEIIFCDPERLPTEGSRNMDSIKPDIKRIIEKYSKITGKLCIEFPPQIRDIPLDCEKEYISVNGALNRLTCYFGSLKKNNFSAVILPENEILSGNNKDGDLLGSMEISSFIYEVDPSIVKAGLVSVLMKKFECTVCQLGKNIFLTSDKQHKSSFFKNSLKVLDTVDFEDQLIIDSLKRINAERVVLRFEVDPSDYWKIRNKFEKPLIGDKKVFLLKIDEKAVICEDINP